VKFERKWLDKEGNRIIRSGYIEKHESRRRNVKRRTCNSEGRTLQRKKWERWKLEVRRSDRKKLILENVRNGGSEVDKRKIDNGTRNSKHGNIRSQVGEIFGEKTVAVRRKSHNRGERSEEPERKYSQVRRHTRRFGGTSRTLTK